MGDPSARGAEPEKRNIEHLAGARLTEAGRLALLSEQTECTFAFVDDDGGPAAVVLSYVAHADRFWFTSVEGRAQVRAAESDSRACVVVSSSGTSLAGRQMLSVRGTVTIHRDPASIEPILRVLAGRLAPSGPENFLQLLRSPGRVVIEFNPSSVIASHDSRRLPGDGRGGQAAE